MCGLRGSMLIRRAEILDTLGVLLIILIVKSLGFLGSMMDADTQLRVFEASERRGPNPDRSRILGFKSFFVRPFEPMHSLIVIPHRRINLWVEHL